CEIQGTIDDNSAFDVKVPFGSRKPLKCGLLPYEAISSINGYWYAQTVTSSNDILSIRLENDEAVILPPEGRNLFDIPGVAEVECVFHDRNSHEKYFEFRKKLNVDSQQPIDVVYLESNYIPLYSNKILSFPLKKGENLKWNVTFNNDSDLLSYSYELHCIIISPYGKYDKSGEVIFQTQQINENTGEFIRNTGRLGTLNGIDDLDVIVSVGSSEIFKCGMIPKEDGGFWKAEIFGDKKDIVSLVYNNGNVYITPKRCDEAYVYIGQVQIQCSFSRDYRYAEFIFTKTLYIVDSMLGTLDGQSTENVQIYVGSRPNLMCGLLPRNIESKLNGYWTARVVRGSKNYVNFESQNGSVFIKPSEKANFYSKPFDIEIECNYSKHRIGGKIFTFTKSMKVKDNSNVTYNYLMALMAFWLIVLHMSCWTVYKLVLLCDLSNLLALRYDTEITHHLYCQDYHHYYQNNYILPMTSINYTTSVKSLPDREGLISSSELLIDFIRSSMKIDEYQKMQED
ncbi:unnamed protein product, partial [Trichobilharzia regenti]